MKWYTLKYLFKEGLIGLWRNRLMALASIITIVLCLLILGASYSFTQNASYILEQLESHIGITAYIDEGVGEERIAQIEAQIKAIDAVTDVYYVSKEEALRSFSLDQENSELFDDFKDDNPLPASFEMRITEASRQHEAVEQLMQIPELQVSYFEREAELFTKANSSIYLASMVTVGSLLIISILLIANTIKLTVYVRRREINIMKYIGATDKFIRFPFLVEGFAIGCIGALVPIFIIAKVYSLIYELSVNSLRNIMGTLELYSQPIIMSNIIPMFIGIGVGIGVIGSMIAIRKHLKV